MLMLAVGPLFVCMPLTNDTLHYDLQAWNLLNGGTLYADLLEPNFPGIIWMHIAIRSCVGWSSEAMRFVDLTFYAMTLTFLGAGLRHGGWSLRATGWLSVVLTFAYFSQTEWCHTQRDGWLLLPTTAAIWLRQRQIRRSRHGASLSSLVGAGFLEGLVWGVAVWLKPYIVIPAFLAWFVSLLRLQNRPARLADFAGLLLGGLCVGGAGLGWMIASGTWVPFWEMVQNWAPYYWEARLDHWTLGRFLAMSFRMLPWIFLEPLGVLVSLGFLAKVFLHGAPSPEADQQAARVDLAALWGAVCTGWFIQGYAFQHLFDYVHWPLLWLSTVVASLGIHQSPSRLKRIGAYGFAILALVISPCCDGSRLAYWASCWQEGSSPPVRNGLALIPTPNWEDLANAERFLRAHNVQNGDVDCTNNSLIALYCDLKILPPHRYAFQESMAVILKPLRRQILMEIAAGPQRYVVSDYASYGWLPARRLHPARNPSLDSIKLPDAARTRYPWAYPIVHQAGTLVIRQVPAPSAPH